MQSSDCGGYSGAAAKNLYSETICVLCDDSFNLELGTAIFFKHLFEVHHLIIDNTKEILNLHKYIQYWKKVFNHVNFSEVIPSVKIDDTDERYFVLSTLLKEDRYIRHCLKLKDMLHVQEMERKSCDFKTNCLLCKLNFEGSRADYIKHLWEQHNFNVGSPENLVYIDKMLDLLKTKLDSFICVYCEKQFPSWVVMKEHMRKKLHKCINPNNREYDQFFSTNYLDPNEKFSTHRTETDILPLDCTTNSDEEYSDWLELPDTIICLFCPFTSSDIDQIWNHMTGAHDFNFKQETKPLNFYQRVKLINYIRREMDKNECFYCQELFGSIQLLLSHLEQVNHAFPPLKYFDQPEFFFSTKDNDAILYHLEEVEDPENNSLCWRDCYE